MTVVVGAGVGGVAEAAEAVMVDGEGALRVRAVMPILPGTDRSRINTRPVEGITTGSEATIKRWREQVQAYLRHNVPVDFRFMGCPCPSSENLRHVLKVNIVAIPELKSKQFLMKFGWEVRGCKQRKIKTLVIRVYSEMGMLDLYMA